MSEWPIDHAWKACILVRVSRVRIPPSPPSPRQSSALQNDGGLRPYLARLRRDKSAIINYVYYAYLLRCADNKTYIGSTQDLKDRFRRHKSGFVPATKNRLPVILHFYMAFQDKYKAFNFEKYLKSGSGRAFLKKRLL